MLSTKNVVVTGLGKKKTMNVFFLNYNSTHAAGKEVFSKAM